MDALDVRILRALGTRPFADGARSAGSVSSIALSRRLHVSRNTVHERIAGLKASGVLVRFQAYPNLRHLGVDWTAFHLHFSDDASRQDAASRARAMRRVSRVLEFLGPDVCVDLYHGAGPEKDEDLREVCQGPAAQIAHTLENRTMPPVRRTLSPMDWRIIQSLRGDGRRPLKDVADDLGTSYRTVKRRVDAMCEGGDLDICVDVDPARIPGAIPLGMVFKLRKGRTTTAANALRRALDERYFIAYAPANEMLGDLAIEAYATTAAEIETLRQRAMAVVGVEGLTILVSQRISFNGGWIDEAIRRKLAETSARPRIRAM